MTYEPAGVTVINMKLEQSDFRTETAGSLPGRVPVTPLAQLSSLHPLRAKMLERAPWARPNTKMKARTFIAICAEGQVQMRLIYIYK
jgi:hypothetical protein